MSALLLFPRQMVTPDPEQQPVAAGVLTIGVHVAFAAVLFLNMNWDQTIRPQASVKLWHSIPATKPDPVIPRESKRRSSSKPAQPASPNTPPAPQRNPKTTPQPKPTTAAAVNAQPPSPVAATPRPVVPDRPVFETTPLRATRPVSQSQTATVAPATPPAPSAIPDVAQPVELRTEPARAELETPERKRAAPPVAESPKPIAAAPPPSQSPAQLQQQPDRKPEVDVEALRRDRALALAEQLREEESERLNATLEREQNERSEENQKRREERERQLAQELQEISVAAEKRRAEQDAIKAQEAAAKGIEDDFRARISAKIRQRVILPPDLRGNPEALYEVSLLPGGEVIQVQLLQSSGVLTYDEAVERAILAAQPLPVPEDPGIFHANFKNFLLSFRPKE